MGLLLAFLPLPCVSGFDHVLCMAVGCLLVWEIGMRNRVSRPWTVAAGLLFVLIHPQTVNVSSVYSTSLMVMGLAASLMPEAVPNPAQNRRYKELLIPGLLLGALASLKVPAAFFGAFFGVSLMLVRYRDRTDTVKWLKDHLLLAGLALLATLPWVAVLFDRFRMIFADKGPYAEYSPPDGLVSWQDFGNLWGVGRLHHGGNLLGYKLAVAILLLFVGGWLLRRGQSRTAWQVPVCAAGLAWMASFALHNYLFPMEIAIRYSVPALLACLPMTLLAIGWNLQQGGPAGLYVRSLQSVAGLTAVVGMLFVSPLYERLQQVLTWRTYVPWKCSERLAQYNTAALHPDTAEQLRLVQQSIPEGAAVFVFTRLPFLMDYARNRVHIAINFGMAAPWNRPPLTGKAEDMRAFLRANGIEYVMLERDSYPPGENPGFLGLLHSGLGIHHKVATYDVAMYAGLYELAAITEATGEFGSLVVYRVPPE